MQNFADQSHYLNNPDTRQALLRARLHDGKALVAHEIAADLCVSLDTVRRDLIALEQAGLLKRVKGGALPVMAPALPLKERLKRGPHWLMAAEWIIAETVADCRTLMIDGGTSALHFARQLPAGFRGLLITPSPLVAAIGLERQIETFLIGGRISPSGGIAVGHAAVRATADCAADLCVLGACGLDHQYGLTADDCDEADLKRCMANAATRVLVLAGRSKLAVRARHRALNPEAIDIILTDAAEHDVAPYADLGIEMRFV